ncbi:Tc toxin subunit A [Xenorhabdus sp. PB30.3]|uniref:Tc toxin subunit A-related protein n=1 Tax=Xenorhabdus sp. PB30.3 TaxID=2788941 RepID=UPI001E538EA2|nr:Tc toxin subunit A [Xenorhabdus sp. PB30.3]MCC8379371.1 hypothetical protein [Xenorhabdus sp. PB30.3]
MANNINSQISYKTLFNDNQDLYCFPGLPEANDGPLAYLVELYQQIQMFEKDADKESARFLSQRRADIEKLLLDSTNLNQTSSLLPLVIEALAEKVKTHINNNQPLTHSLADIHYPLSLPFHFPLKQTTTVLAKKEIPLLDLIQRADSKYPNFIDDNLSADSLQTAMMISSTLAPKLQALLLETSQSSQKDFFEKYYGIKGDTAKAAGSLERLTRFTQQTGLTSQEAESLFAVNGIAEETKTHSIVTYSGNVTKPDNADKQFPSGANYAASYINAGKAPALYLEKTKDKDTAKDVIRIKEASNDNFDRIQRFLHIQKALKLSYEDLDLLLATASKAEKQTEFLITEATLRTLGVFLHFQQEYNVTAEQFAAFIGQVTPYSLENKLSFFDQLFNAPGLSQQASSSFVLVLDDKEFDPAATEGIDALTINQLCRGLNIDDATCQILLSFVMQAQNLNKPKRSLDVVSALYRLVAIPRILRMSVKESLGLLLLLNRDNPNYLQQLAGIPILAKDAKAIDILDVLIAVMNATQWIKQHNLSPLSLNLLLMPYQSGSNTSADIENIDWIKKIRSVIPSASDAMLSEDKIASAMQGFQAKNTSVIWMTALAKLVDTQFGIILDSVISTSGESEKALFNEVNKILKDLAQEAAWKQQGDIWTQNLVTLLTNAFVAQQDLIINAVNHVFGIDNTLSLPLLRWTNNKQADFLRNTIALSRNLGDQQRKDKAVAAWYDLSRYAAICNIFKLTEKSIETLIDHPDWFKLQKDGKLRALDLTFLHRLSRYSDWLSLLPENKTEDDVIYYLRQANQIGQNPPATNVWTAEQAAANLAELIGWSDKEILRVTQYFAPKVAQNIVGISNVMRLKALAEKSEMSVQPLLDVAKLSTTSSYDHWHQVSSALFAAINPKDQSQPEGLLNELWRDALVDYLLRRWAPSDDSLSDIVTIEDLSNYFLTDIQVAAEVDTSRVAFAIASLQRYLFRLFSCMEIGYGVQTISDERVENWNRYLSQYSHWQVLQRQNNFPENFIDPARRLRKTRAFTDLENDLGQSRLNNDMIQTAILRYLTEFERISNLQLISGYINGTDPASDSYHFIGKNNAEPVEYYWRSLDISLRDSNNVISPLAWREWEKITLSLSGTLLAIRPIVISGRQYAIWVEREATPLMGVDQKPTDYRAINVKFTFKQSNGEWSAPNMLFRLDGTDANGEYPTKDGKRILDKDNPYLKDEKYKPALIAMVDVQREDDPWMGVLLYDSTKTDTSIWKKNTDYYLELRDLLLVDKKTLNKNDEINLVTSWYKIFNNPDTLQHHYAGTQKFITLKPDEHNRYTNLVLKAKLNEDGTKIILNGFNTLIKRNPKNLGTMGEWKIDNISSFPSEEINTEIHNDDIHIKINIPASDTSIKTFNFEWLGEKEPEKTCSILYNQTELFFLLPNESKNKKLTKTFDFNWINQSAYQKSTQWNVYISKKISIASEEKIPLDQIIFSIEDGWENTETELALKINKPYHKELTKKKTKLNGKASTGEIIVDLISEEEKYNFTLSSTLEVEVVHANVFVNKNLIETSNEYQFTVKDIDKVPSITLRRTDKQAQYLDIQSLNFSFNAIRLNTLFGKQLVARATQSIDRVLAWDTQSLSEPELDDTHPPVKVDFHGANGLYFWELFFHMPFLVSSRLSEEQRFYDARYWLLKYLFNPYGTIRMWNSRPIIEPGSNLPQIRNYDPDTIAYSLPIYYQKALFHFLIRLWIQEGDNLYRQLTRDSLNEAGLCYQQALLLLGTLPEGLDATHWHPMTLEEIKTSFKPQISLVNSLFKSPFNNQLINAQKTLENRLHNLRHGLTLDGKIQPLPLYSSIADSNSLALRNSAYANNLPSNLQQQVPPYRFPIMLRRASEAVKQLTEMGHRLFQAIESKINIEQKVLEQSHVLRLSAFAIELQQEAVQIAKLGKATLEESKKMAQERHEHYHNLYEENLSALETSALAIKTSAEAVKAAASPFYAAGAALEVVPNIFGLAVGGGKYAAPIKNAAIISELISSVLALTADRLQDSADYERRRQEWEIEYKQAQSEINIIESQLQEQELLIKSANTALREAQAQQSAARELYEFMTSGFLIVPTYQWLMGRLAALYAPAYDAVLSMCLMAESSWRYEVGDYKRQGFIKTSAWNDSYRGLLAGESLQLDLLQMENAWLQRNERRLNIKKTVSLSSLLTSGGLRKQIDNKQSISFTLNSKLFDDNYPGHYLRQIKRISVSISLDTLNLGSVLSSEISAILTQTSSSTLTHPDMDGVNWLYDPNRKAGNSKNVVNNLRAQQQIALSSLSEDDGSVAKENWLYTLMFDDDRYLPFEGTGAISTWTLEFPDQDVIDNIFYYPGLVPVWRLKDINIHIHYTAVDGGKPFAKAVKDKMNK